ncbi:M67 family metallopeptidase [Paenibacillus sp. sgz5001063]|uniref:M67 family metallopeptidase n=1 Tax=Paenibacillus sp. sgz5001063 TaxID=3242474 RepID=UPI0036D3652E
MTAFQGNIQPIQLNLSVQQALGKHLLTCYPHEACGVLLGTAAAGGMRIDRYLPMRNVAPDPLHTFVPDPGEWIRILYHEPARVGLFHSHPHTAPWPSSADIQGLFSLGPEFQIYLIGSPDPESGESIRLNGFHILRQTDPTGQLIVKLLPTPVTPC